jgi:hypothetical protein
MIIRIALPVLALTLLAVVPVYAASPDEQEVAAKVEAFRAAQFASDPKALADLCADELSYSHSSGKLEDKATFIANATDGKSKWASLEYRDPWIRIVGPVAVVRFHFIGEQESMPDGKRSYLHILKDWVKHAIGYKKSPPADLYVLMNWIKQGSDWKLLSRAAAKL